MEKLERLRLIDHILTYCLVATLFLLLWSAKNLGYAAVEFYGAQVDLANMRVR